MPAVVPRSARPDARPEISPDALLVPLAPYEAYAADVDRLDGRAPLGAADDVWLTLAHTLARAAALPRGERAAVCAAGARTMAAVVPEHGDERVCAVVAAAGDALADLAARLPVCASAGTADEATDVEAVGAAVAALQAVIAQEEQAEAFFLAFGTLAVLRRIFAPVLDLRSRGLLLAQQGRVARQLGALATAARLYRKAARAGRHAGAPDVAARALLGAGALASNRGNYPKSRALYRRALREATLAGSAFLQRASHHGLLIAAFAANDVNAALAHGWAAARRLPDDAADERAEAFLNLGEVGRQSGEYRAALGACLSAIELTNLPRLRLSALGTAARAAAALGEHRLLTFLARDIERTVARSSQQFENARALVELGEAYDGLQNAVAIEYAARAQSLAATGTFHEISARADRIIAGDANEVRPRFDAVCDGADARSPRARAVLRTLEALPATRRYEETAAC